MSVSLNKKHNVLIGVTGSVATIKIEEIISRLREALSNVNICLVATKNANHFAQVDKFIDKKDLQGKLALIKQSDQNGGNFLTSFSDEDEWSAWSQRGDPVLHIELRKWADLFLIAPLDANSMAKLANGICDNLLTCIARAWDFSKPIIICPAMNTFMYEHFLTAKHLKGLRDIGYIEIEAIEKTLVCGDHGIGAMCKVETIIEKVLLLVK